MNILILGNGEINDYNFLKKYTYNSDIVICCDGGLRHASKLEVAPNYIIGDCDSVSEELLSEYIKKNVELIKFKKEKDFTDMELGLDFAISLKAKYITILGGIGSRVDHTLANVHILLKALNKNVVAKLVNEQNEILLINKDITLSEEKGTFISLIPVSTEVCSVLTNGLKYPLVNENLYLGETRGVSNEVLENEVFISIASGLLLVILARD